MKKISADNATKHLPTLVDRTAKKDPKRLGFMNGEIEVPDDFDRMDEQKIAELFGVEED
jgi:hypothetical protein